MGFLSRKKSGEGEPSLPPPQGDQIMSGEYSEYSEYEWGEDDGMGAITEASETSSWGGHTSDRKSAASSFLGDDRTSYQGSRVPSMMSDATGSEYYDGDSQWSDGDSRISSMTSDATRSMQPSYRSTASSRVPSMMSDATRGQSVRQSTQSTMSEDPRQSTASFMSESSYASRGQSSRVPSMMSDATRGQSVRQSTQSSRVPSMMSDATRGQSVRQSTQSSRVPSMMSDASRQSYQAPSMRQSSASSRVPSMMSDATRGQSVRQSSKSSRGKSVRQSSKSTASSRVPSMMSDATRGQSVRQSTQSYMSDASRQSYQVPSMRQSTQSSRVPSMMSDASRGQSVRQSTQSYASEASRFSVDSHASKAQSHVPSMRSEGNRESYMSQESGWSDWDDQTRNSMMSEGGQSMMSDNRQSMMSEGGQSMMSDNRQSMMSEGGQSMMSDNRQSMMSEGGQSMMSDGRQSYMSSASRQSGRSSRQSSRSSSRQSSRSSSRQSSRSSSRKSNRSTRSSTRSKASKYRSQNPNNMAHHSIGGEAIPEEDTYDDEDSFGSYDENQGNENFDEDDEPQVSSGGHSRYVKSDNGKWVATQSTRLNFVPMFLKRQTLRMVRGGDLGRAAYTHQKGKPEYYTETHEAKPDSDKPNFSGRNSGGSNPDRSLPPPVGGGNSRYKRGADGRWEATQSTRMNFVPGMLKRFTMRVSRDNNNLAGGLGRNTMAPKAQNVAEGYFGGKKGSPPPAPVVEEE